MYGRFSSSPTFHIAFNWIHSFALNPTNQTEDHLKKPKILLKPALVTKQKDTFKTIEKKLKIKKSMRTFKVEVWAGGVPSLPHCRHCLPLCHVLRPHTPTPPILNLKPELRLKQISHT